MNQDDMQIRVLKFKTTYPLKNGEAVQVDWCEFTTPGCADFQRNEMTIKELSSVIPLTDQNRANPAIAMANERWKQIKPSYEAWKADEDIPLDGTPLKAWAGVSPEQIDALKASGFRTVEDLANAGDASMARINLPNRNQYRDLAKSYLKSQDGVKAAAELEARDKQIAELQEQMAEMKKMMAPKKTTRKKDNEAA
jgi:hypothetical protein